MPAVLNLNQIIFILAAKSPVSVNTVLQSSLSKMCNAM